SLSSPALLFNRTAAASNVNADKLGNKKEQTKFPQADSDLFITELSAKLAKRAGKENIMGENTSQGLKPWQKELAEQKAAYARAEPERETSEAKEEARVALALAEAKASKEVKQNAIEAEKASKPLVPLKMDGRGIPLPPPPPPPPPPLSRALSYPSALSNRSVDKSDNKGAQVNSLQKALYAELSGVLAKRRGKENIMDASDIPSPTPLVAKYETL
ncbi:hypothetical protein H5A43_06675, partial [Pectobacterium brasiliense]|nr:hypothetical protein [Pectobacterium brasiliense]